MFKISLNLANALKIKSKTTKDPTSLPKPIRLLVSNRVAATPIFAALAYLAVAFANKFILTEAPEVLRPKASILFFKILY